MTSHRRETLEIRTATLTADYVRDGSTVWRAENHSARRALVTKLKAEEIEGKAKRAGREARRIANRNRHGGRRRTHRQKRAATLAATRASAESGAGSP